MRAIGVTPNQREIALIDHPEPKTFAPSQVKIRTLDVGICGTDKEICHFDYGTPPVDSDYLVLGHEGLGEVMEVGDEVSELKRGDLVVPSVRRPCPHEHCGPCREDLQDFCFTGDFTERGIKMTHGFMTEYFVEDEKFLARVPADLRDVAVLVEPLTVAEKGLTQVWRIQQRMPWAGPSTDGKGPGHSRRAVVLGAGPVGSLGAMKLVADGFDTYVYSRSKAPNPKSELVESFGAKYLSAQTYSVEALAERVGNIDVVYEAVGVPRISFEVMKVLGMNGIFVFTGIPAWKKKPIDIDADLIMRNMVLKNQLVVGTVNADRDAFEAAIHDIGVFARRWPDALRSLITGRYSIESYRDLLFGDKKGIKNVIAFA
jgi:threonine dehydrogenase-like Zn-dependent dehydrogenase